MGSITEDCGRTRVLLGGLDFDFNIPSSTELAYQTLCFRGYRCLAFVLQTFVCCVDIEYDFSITEDCGRTECCIMGDPFQMMVAKQSAPAWGDPFQVMVKIVAE